jgi:hypothetical protein
MVSVDENRVEFEINLITDLIFRYFDYIAHFVFDENVTCVTDFVLPQTG